MNGEKPYQPSEEEMKKAEHMLTAEQRQDSEVRAETFSVEKDVTPENKEVAPKLEWSSPMHGHYADALYKIKEYNSKLRTGEKQWRMPLVEELVSAIEKGEVNNDTGDNIVRWSWTGTSLGVSWKNSRRSPELLAKDAERHEKQSADKEGHYYVVKRNGEVDTPSLWEYGYRLVREK